MEALTSSLLSTPPPTHRNKASIAKLHRSSALPGSLPHGPRPAFPPSLKSPSPIAGGPKCWSRVPALPQGSADDARAAERSYDDVEEAIRRISDEQDQLRARVVEASEAACNADADGASWSSFPRPEPNSTLSASRRGRGRVRAPPSASQVPRLLGAPTAPSAAARPGPEPAQGAAPSLSATLLSLSRLSRAETSGTKRMVAMVAAWDAIASRLPPSRSPPSADGGAGATGSGAGGGGVQTVLAALRLALMAQQQQEERGRGKAGQVWRRETVRVANEQSGSGGDGRDAFTRGVAVAAILADLRMEPDVIAAGLLSVTVQRGHVTLPLVHAHVSPAVARLLHDCARLHRLPKRVRALDDDIAAAARQFALAFHDPRAVVLQIAAKLDAMQHLSAPLAPPSPPLSPSASTSPGSSPAAAPPRATSRQQMEALEAIQVWAPLAHTLGIGALTWQMEDAALRHLFPRSYVSIQAWVAAQWPGGGERLVGEVRRRVEEVLAGDAQLRGAVGGWAVSGRVKSMWSVMKKVLRDGRPRTRVNDLFGLRIVLSPRARAGGAGGESADGEAGEARGGTGEGSPPGEGEEEEAEREAAEACYRMQQLKGVMELLAAAAAGSRADLGLGPRFPMAQLAQGAALDADVAADVSDAVAAAAGAGREGLGWSGGGEREEDGRTEWGSGQFRELQGRQGRGEREQEGEQEGSENTPLAILKGKKDQGRAGDQVGGGVEEVKEKEVDEEEEDHDHFFAMLDLNGDGVISVEEMSQFMQQLGAGEDVSQLTGMAGAEGGGGGGRAEGGAGGREAAEELVALLDANMDGSICAKEFAAFRRQVRALHSLREADRQSQQHTDDEESGDAVGRSEDIASSAVDGASQANAEGDILDSPPSSWDDSVDSEWEVVIPSRSPSPSPPASPTVQYFDSFQAPWPEGDAEDGGEEAGEEGEEGDEGPEARGDGRGAGMQAQVVRLSLVRPSGAGLGGMAGGQQQRGAERGGDGSRGRQGGFGQARGRARLQGRQVRVQGGVMKSTWAEGGGVGKVGRVRMVQVTRWAQKDVGPWWWSEAGLTAARNMMDELLARHPSNANVLVHMAQLERHAGNTGAARQWYERSAQCFEARGHLGRQYVRALQAWGMLEALDGRIAASRRLFEHSLQVAWKAERRSGQQQVGAVVVGLHAWAMVERRVGNFTAARHLLQRAERVEPGNAVVLQARALLEAAVGHLSAARHFFKRAAAADPADAACWQAWAVTEARAGRVDRMRDLFSAALSVHPSSLPTLHAWACEEARLGSAQSLQRARDLFTRCLNVDPECAYALQSWAVMEQRVGNVTQARTLFDRCLQIAPSSVPALQAYAVMERKQGNALKARALLALALSLQPNNAAVLQELHPLLHVTCPLHGFPPTYSPSSPTSSRLSLRPLKSRLSFEAP
ncbi:unnamed protein product [Closterium sp. Yama58-4]|nr:unnamed protein product [Closterium sp. Yama58-4]